MSDVVWNSEVFVKVTACYPPKKFHFPAKLQLFCPVPLRNIASDSICPLPILINFFSSFTMPSHANNFTSLCPEGVSEKVISGGFGEEPISEKTKKKFRPERRGTRAVSDLRNSLPR